MNLPNISKRRVVRLWMLTVVSLAGVCLLACIVLGILTLTASPTSDTKQTGTPKMEDSDTPVVLPTVDASEDIQKAVGLAPHPRVLEATADMGQGYIDRMVFVGESTTAHLRSRGVLSGGTATNQVWSNKENTMTLDLNILQKTIRYPATGQNMTIPEAAALAKPDYIVLSFGLNGIHTFVANEGLYQVAYGKLIDAIHMTSPETVVLLQTIYPVAKNQTTFSEGAVMVNEYIRRLNECLPAIAEQHGAYVLDTACCLSDRNGMLRSDFQNGDGIHLSTGAYHEILSYLRTHAYMVS